MPERVIDDQPFFPIVLRLLLVQMPRATMEVGGHTPQPLVPLRSGFEFSALQMQRQISFAVKFALQRSEMAQKRKNHFRDGFTSGVRDHR